MRADRPIDPSSPSDPLAPGDGVGDGEPTVVRPVGTRSFVFGAKVLLTSVVALVLAVATDADTWPAFWVLVSVGLLGVGFAFIERGTGGAGERISQRRINVDVVGMVALATLVNVVVVLAGR